MERYFVPIYIPKGIYSGLRRVKRSLLSEPEEKISTDLFGDRDIEWSFIASRMPIGPGDVLDFGCGFGNLSIHAIQRGFRVIALDLEQQRFPWTHPNLEIVHGDLLKLNLPTGKFDLILNCSTVEHVGLSGRYGVFVQETDGDLAAMQRLRKLMKSSGKMLMTIPCGRDAAISPWHRVYGRERLPKLLDGFDIEEQHYWIKHKDNRWHPSNREAALSYIPTSHPRAAVKCCYALGCFVLQSHSL